MRKLKIGDTVRVRQGSAKVEIIDGSLVSVEDAGITTVTIQNEQDLLKYRAMLGQDADQTALNLQPAPALGYSREGDVVTVRLTSKDFDGLLMCLGFATALTKERGYGPIAFRLANAINAGRPLADWRPYALPDEGAGE